MQFALLVQLVGQVAEEPPQTYGLHDGLPALDTGSVVQVPSAVDPSA